MKLELAKSQLADSASCGLSGQGDMPTTETSVVEFKEEQQEGREQSGAKTLAKLAEEYTQPFCGFLTENPTV